jgi:hypothetical protein
MSVPSVVMEYSPEPGDRADDEPPLDAGAEYRGGGEETLPDGLEVDLGTLDSIEAELDEVELALRRLDDGSYGRCEVCDAPLDEAELVDVPMARFCPAHVPTRPE